MFKLTRNIYGVLLLRDGNELHRLNKLFSLEEYGLKDNIKGINNKTLFMDDR